MITSDRQYRATLEAIERFEAALARETMAEAYEGQLQLLRAQVSAYEAGLAPSETEKASPPRGRSHSTRARRPPG
jgi:hypothetical protein